MSNGNQLLRRYVEEGSESAFTEIVHDHVDMVYSAALREMNGDQGLAEDISQAVFAKLAEQARRLTGHPVLSGWLYTTVRHIASNVRRAEHRRHRREEEAHSMNELLSEHSPDECWQRLRPVLDDALHEMKEADREAIVLRFLEDRSLREVGERLGLNENAARMRVERALEKLRGLLVRRGLTSTASGLTAALAVGVLTPAPETLAATIAGSALAGGAVAGSAAITTIKLMSLTKISLVGALAVAAIAVPAWQQTRVRTLKTENLQLRSHEQELASLREEAVKARNAETKEGELERLRQWQARTEPELLRLRGMAGVARRANAEAEQLRAQLARQTSEAGGSLISGAMADAMKQAMEQQVESRLSRLNASLRLTPEQLQAAREILERQARAMSAGMQQAFTGKYDKDEIARLGKEAGDPDEQIKALLSPAQKAGYPAYKQDEAAYNARLVANNELLQLQTMGLSSDQEDRAFAALYELSFNELNGTASTPPTTNQAQAFQWQLDQKTKALEPILMPAQMESYRQQQALQAKLVKDIWNKMGRNDTPKDATN